MDVRSFVFRESMVGSKMTYRKTTFFAIFDPAWTHILDPKDPNQIRNSLNRVLFFNQLYYYQFDDFKTDQLLASFDPSWSKIWP